MSDAGMPSCGNVMANPGYDRMADEPDEEGRAKTSAGVFAGGTSRALSAALKNTFESLLEEPVPDRFQELIARIRQEETRKSTETDDEDA